jgi:hypothetical protein
MDKVAKAISDLVPDLAPTLDQARMGLNDLNKPQNERLADAESIGDILNLGIAEVRNRQNMAMKQQELDARFAPQAPEPAMPRGNPFWLPNPQNPEEEIMFQSYNDGTVREARRSGDQSSSTNTGAESATDYNLPSGNAQAIGDAATGFGMVLPSIDDPPEDGSQQPTEQGDGRITRPIQGAADKGKWEQGVVQNGVVGQQNSGTGEFKAYPGQTGGTSFRMNPETGEVELLQGAAAGKGAKEEMQEQALARAKLTTSAFTIRDATRVIDGIVKTNPRIRQLASMGGGVGKLLFAGTEALDTVNLLETVRSSIAISELVNLRATGTTLGQVPQNQLAYLSTLMGTLNPEISNEKLLTTLEDIYDTYGYYLKETVQALPKSERNEFSPLIREYNNFMNTIWGRGIPNSPPQEAKAEEIPESMDNIINRFQTLQQQRLQQQQQGR